MLRPGTVHGSRFVVLVLRRLLRALRAAWPGVAVAIRADGGFAVPRLYAWCEANDVGYTIGLVPNAALARLAAPLLAAAERQSAAAGGVKVRLADEAPYQAGSWPAARRVVFKAEVLAEGPNTRFVLTTRAAAPLAVYDGYVDRGQAENWIKDWKNALQGDRLSDHRFWANAFRVLLHSAAFWLLDTLRRRLAAADREAARVQLDTLRLRLLKVGGRVRELPGRVRLHLASSHPGEPLWHLLAAARLTSVNNPGYAVTSRAADRASAGDLLRVNRGHWSIENGSHWVRDVVLGEDASLIRSGAAPRVVAACRNLTLALLRRAGYPCIAAALRTLAARPAAAVALVCSAGPR